MVDQVKYSVVRISNLYGSGSGVIVQVYSSNNSALILTNYHVLRGRSEVDVTVYDFLTYRGQITWIDQKRDLGMVSICCMVLNAIPFGNGNDLRSGQEVITMDYPLGLKGEVTVTKGIISAIRYDGQNDRWLIQTDAPINPGNS